MHEILRVTPGDAPPYPVLLGDDPAVELARRWDADWRRAVIIGDACTAALFAEPIARALAAFSPLRLCFPAGEAHKTRATKEALEDAMLAAAVDRGACVVAVGGGIALDVAGFVAATYMRGLPHVAVATTLLAQVDASIGGKTGLNTPLGKNLVGAFHHPRAVLCDLGALATLPARELENGWAELVKHAALGDAELLDDIERWLAALPAGAARLPPEGFIARSLALKARIVAADPRERGERALLNFGHTVGHALEHASGHTLGHGEAIAVGMVVEARWAAACGRFPAAQVDRLARLLTLLGLPRAPVVPFASARPFLQHDKKNDGETVRCAVPCALGAGAAEGEGYTHAAPLDELAHAWEQSCRAG